MPYPPLSVQLNGTMLLSGLIGDKLQAATIHLLIRLLRKIFLKIPQLSITPKKRKKKENSCLKESVPRDVSTAGKLKIWVPIMSVIESSKRIFIVKNL